MKSRKIVMDRCLYRYSPHVPMCCHCTKTCRYYGTCCIDAFLNNDILSVEEYIEIFYKITEITNYVKTLPVIKFEGTYANFPWLRRMKIDNYPTIIFAIKMT